MGTEIAHEVIALTSLIDVCETPKVVLGHLLGIQRAELSVRNRAQVVHLFPTIAFS